MDQIKRDKSGHLAALVSFQVKSKRFDSNYERNKFYRGLYGWKQVIKRNGKRYEYQRSGLLDETPYLKVDKSVLIVPLTNLDKIVDYLEQWKGKVDFEAFKILLGPDKFKKLKGQDFESGWVEIPVE